MSDFEFDYEQEITRLRDEIVKRDRALVRKDVECAEALSRRERDRDRANDQLAAVGPVVAAAQKLAIDWEAGSSVYQRALARRYAPGVAASLDKLSAAVRDMGEQQ